jgi:hypothetical protein
MSKKSLLEEGTVRRFMKLAGTQVLASDFVELNEKKHGGNKGDESRSRRDLEEGKEEDETPLQEQDEELDIEAEVEGPEGGEEIEDMEMDLEEPGADLEVDEEEPEAEEPEAEELVRRMVDAIAGVAEEFGVDVDVSEDAPEAELEVPEFGAEEEGEEEMELGDEEEIEGADEELAGEEEELEGLEEVNYIDEGMILNEVFHRVKNRLIEEKRADQLAAKLASKISRRLNKRSRR